MIKLINSDILKSDFDGIPPINLVVTSPPYNIGINYDGGHSDTMTYATYLSWCEKWLTKMYGLMADDGRICINIPFTVSPKHVNSKKGVDYINYPVVADYTKLCEKIGFKYWRTLVWEKMVSNSATTWGSWRSASSPFMRDPSEAILVFGKNGWKRSSTGESTISGAEFMTYTKNVWIINPETRSKHPAAFPPELPSRCIKLLSYKDDLICDPFLGSGTTGDVAVRLNRNFVGVEMSKEYFMMASERIESAEVQTELIKKMMPNLPVDAKDDIEEVW